MLPSSSTHVFTPLPVSVSSDLQSPSPPPRPPPPLRPQPHSRARFHATSSSNTLEDRILRLIDWTNARLGPILLTIAFVLLSLTTFCYFSVYIPFHYPYPSLHLSPDTDLDTGKRLGGSAEGSPATETMMSGRSKGYYANMVWSLYLVWGLVANYYYAITTPPGSVLSFSDPVDPSHASYEHGHNTLLEMESLASSSQPLPICKHCNLPKPERTHHCNVCKKCILKYDHHCPWIHNCVGHFNHRFFVMFMTNLFVACVYFVGMGVGPFRLLADEEAYWPFWLDRGLVAFSEVVAVFVGLAVGAMAGWHWYLTLTAQTTLEQYSNNYMKNVCKQNGDTFSNMYDFGPIGNLQNFFNIGKRG
ncbi:hypothetical protein BGZ94_007856, partial [Podila epigama]